MIVGTCISLVTEEPSGEKVIFRAKELVAIRIRNYLAANGYEDIIGRIASILPYTNELNLDVSEYSSAKNKMINFNQIIKIEHYTDPGSGEEEDGTKEATFDVNTKNAINLIYQEILETKAITNSCLQKLNTLTGSGTTEPTTDDPPVTEPSETVVTTIAEVELPEVTGITFVYDGESKAPTYTVDTDYVEVSGDKSASTVGNYSLVFSLINTANSKWKDNTTENKTTPWSITAKSIEIPDLTSETYVYTGSDITVTTTYDTENINKSGTDTAIEVGTYNIGFDLKDTINTVWNDNTTETKNKPWEITPKPKTVVESPELTSDKKFSYDGNSKTVTFTYDNENITVTGTETSVAVGEYEVTFTLNDAENSEWDDGTTEPKVLRWEIEKGNQVFSVSPTPENNTYIYGTETSIVFTVDHTVGDGTLEIKFETTNGRGFSYSADEVNVTGNTVTILQPDNFNDSVIFFNFTETNNYKGTGTYSGGSDFGITILKEAPNTEEPDNNEEP